jgi:hypothetical protein
MKDIFWFANLTKILYFKSSNKNWRNSPKEQVVSALMSLFSPGSASKESRIPLSLRIILHWRENSIQWVGSYFNDFTPEFEPSLQSLGTFKVIFWHKSLNSSSRRVKLELVFWENKIWTRIMCWSQS